MNWRYQDKNGLFLVLLLIWDLVNSVAAGDSSIHAAVAGNKDSAGSEPHLYTLLEIVTPF